MGGGPSQPPQARQQPSFQDPFGAPAPSPASAPAQQDLPMLLSADKAKGLTLRGQLARMDGRIGQSFLFLPCGSICELSSTCACARKMDRPCFCFLGVSRLVAEATAGFNTCCHSNHFNMSCLKRSFLGLPDPFQTLADGQTKIAYLYVLLFSLPPASPY